MTIERNQVKAPQLAREVVNVPSIGGEVIVRGMRMSDRMALWDCSKPRGMETDEQAKARAEQFMVAETLARTVVLADDQPLWTVAEWDVFASANSEETLRIFAIANRLSGGDTAAVEKN